MSTFPGLFVTLFVFSLALFYFLSLLLLGFERWDLKKCCFEAFSIRTSSFQYAVIPIGAIQYWVTLAKYVLAVVWNHATGFLNGLGGSVFTYVRWYLFLTFFPFLFSAIDFCCRYALLVFCAVGHESFVILMSPSEAFAFILVFSLPESHFQTWWRFSGNFSCSKPVTFVYFCWFFIHFLMPYPFADDFKVKWFLDVHIFHVNDAN